MSEESSFHDLVRRVRAGEEAAAAELVQQYEPAIRRLIRMRLTDPRLGRVLDSMDICQSVMANFFVRVAAGQFELESPEQLLKLLARMAKNRLLDHARRQQADRRDVRRVQAGDSNALAGVADEVGTPSQIVSGREMLQRMRQELTDDERYLAEQRAQGREWSDLAAELGAKPDALRIKLARAMNRASAKLGLDALDAE